MIGPPCEELTKQSEELARLQIGHHTGPHDLQFVGGAHHGWAVDAKNIFAE